MSVNLLAALSTISAIGVGLGIAFACGFLSEVTKDWKEHK